MRITFTARHGKASESLKEYAEQEVRRLKKYYGAADTSPLIKLDRLN